MKTSEVLDKSADLLEGNWGQGRWFDSAGKPACLEGGIMAAMGMGSAPNSPDDWNSFEACPAYLAVKEHVGTFPYSWNDREQRTEGEVIGLLREVAESERSQGR